MDEIGPDRTHGRMVMGHARLPRAVKLLYKPSSAGPGRSRQQRKDKSAHAAPGDRRWWLADCANRASRAWQCMLHPETSRFICLILARKLISICRQPMLIAATRCYLIQMIRSALTCINGGSCWSTDEENGPRFFLTMDVLCRLS